MLTTPRVRFGIIGAGSANSIVSSVHGINDCPTAAIHIAIGFFLKIFLIKFWDFFKGSRCNIDVCVVYEDGNLLRFSADAISYGWYFKWFFWGYFIYSFWHWKKFLNLFFTFKHKQEQGLKN